ncbi:hypothetical protein SDC9_191692 [bioreactor metagenome]|uniref:Uncharacterized protein n=1 Tax=bioreactor metagenome TaxID=1076179 RepID=A0A645HYL0_9ZZZZ
MLADGSNAQQENRRTNNEKSSKRCFGGRHDDGNAGGLRRHLGRHGCPRGRRHGRRRCGGIQNRRHRAADGCGCGVRHLGQAGRTDRHRRDQRGGRRFGKADRTDLSRLPVGQHRLSGYGEEADSGGQGGGHHGRLLQRVPGGYPPHRRAERRTAVLQQPV